MEEGGKEGHIVFFLGSGQKQTIDRGSENPPSDRMHCTSGLWFGLGIMAVRTFDNETKQIKHKKQFES